jgi:hypothetical protein
MRRFFFLFACGALALGAFVTRSDRGGNRAEIIQSGPEDDAPSVRVEEGDGFVVIEQHDKNNHAIVIQQNGRK